MTAAHGSQAADHGGWVDRSPAAPGRSPAVPPTRPGTVRRAVLIERLAQADPPIVSVAAPSGFGKTTLLAQWAERDGPAFVWVPAEETDNDPKFLPRDEARPGVRCDGAQRRVEVQEIGGDWQTRCVTRA